MESSLLQTQNMLSEKGILISFSGRFSQGIIVELGDAVKSHMENEKRPKSDIHNVFAIFIELSQNIKNYTESKEGTEEYSIIANSSIANIGKSDEGYFIWAGNIIENADVKPLKEKLNQLRSMVGKQLFLAFDLAMQKALPSWITRLKETMKIRIISRGEITQY